jgi:hypothetical protein
VRELYCCHCKTVIENGGRENGVTGRKLLTVDVVDFTVELDSLVSVRFADVNWLTVTLPVGALGPLKVTGNAEVRLRLIATRLRLFAPSVKAKICNW